MLSKRNFAMMITMVVVVLALFLSSVVLKEYFNDYDVNHAADTELIEKNICRCAHLWMGHMEASHICSWTEHCLSVRQKR